MIEKNIRKGIGVSFRMEKNPLKLVYQQGKQHFFTLNTSQNYEKQL